MFFFVYNCTLRTILRTCILYPIAIQVWSQDCVALKGIGTRVHSSKEEVGGLRSSPSPQIVRGQCSVEMEIIRKKKVSFPIVTNRRFFLSCLLDPPSKLQEPSDRCDQIFERYWRPIECTRRYVWSRRHLRPQASPE